jgi:thioredoxin 1
MSVSATSEKTFSNDVLVDQPLPVLVDFWAEWCGPCRMLAPILEDISNEHADKIKIVKLNTDENTDLVTKYEIRSIPTLILFVNGEPVWSMSGAKPKPALLKDLDAWLK